MSLKELNMKFSYSNNKPEHANYTFSVTNNIIYPEQIIDTISNSNSTLGFIESYFFYYL